MMPSVDLNGFKLLRVEYDPYERETDEDEEDDFDYEPDPVEVLIRVDMKIISQAGKQVGRALFWLIDRNDLVELGEDLVALLDGHSSELSDFAATLFDRRGQVRSHVAREGKGIWGRELNADTTVAYLQEFRVDRELRSQGIGRWALGQILKHNDVYIDGAQFIYTFPCAINPEWPQSTSWSGPDPYVAEKAAVTARLVGFYRRLGFRRIGTTTYFCRAHSGSHPSHAVPVDQDADMVKPAHPFAGMDPTMARTMTILSRQDLI